MRWMRDFCHHHPSQDEVTTFKFANPSSDAHSKRKLIYKVAEEKKRCLNSERWEKRAKEKFGELKGKVEELETVIKIMSGENKALQKKLDELVGQNSKLKQRVRCFTARFDSHVQREPQKIKTAVQQALSSVFVS